MLGSFSGGGLGFGLAFSLYDNFSQTSAEIERSMSSLEGSAEQVSNRVNTSMNQMAVGAGMLGAGIALLAPIGFGLKISAEFEQARIGLKTFLKTTEEVDRVFSNIQKDALVSATFDTQGLLSVNSALISAGVQADKAREDTNNLANAIAAVGKGNAELQNMAVNMQQIKNAGKASSMDIKQFAFAGINIYQLLADYTGKTIDQTREMTVTYDLLTASLKKSAQAGGLYYGASEAQSKSINGMISNIGENWTFTLAAIGDAVKDQFVTMLEYAVAFLGVIRDFAGSPFGKWIVRIVAVLGIALVLFGAMLVVTNLLRVSVFKLAGVFGDQTKAMILQTIAQKGVVAGFRQMAVAAWASLGPYLLIAAGIAAVVILLIKVKDWMGSSSVAVRKFAYGIIFLLSVVNPLFLLVGAFLAIRQGLIDFDNYMAGTTKRLKGIMGFFQQLGGIIRALGEVFSSWDENGDGTVAFSEKMWQAMDNLGIREFVVNLVTWMSALQAFWTGLKQGFMDAVGAVKKILLGLANIFLPATDAFHSWNDLIGKNQRTMEDWANYGKIAGYMIAGFILYLAWTFGVMAVSVIAATWPIVAIIVGLWLLYEAVSYVIANWDAWGDAINNWISETWNNLLTFFTDMPSAMFQWGSDMISGLLEGLKSMWTTVVDWLKNAFNDSFLGKAMEFLGVGTFETQGTPVDGKPKGGGSDGGGLFGGPGPSADFSNNLSSRGASKAVAGKDGKSANSQMGAQTINMPVYLDGTLIGNHTEDLQNRKEHRKNG